MPLTDVTIDTNVFMHACNSTEPRQGDSIGLMRSMLASTTNLAIDSGFSVDPAKNTSLIGAEYLSKLVPGTLPHMLVAHLAGSGRVTIVSGKMSSQDSKKLNQMIANRRDRTFVKVAASSSSCCLVSHDFLDFSKAKRKTIRGTFGVEMIEACTCIGLV